MRLVEKKFTKEVANFNGSYKIFILNTNSKEFQNFLDNHTTDKGNIYQSIQKKEATIIVIQNLQIEKQFQNKGHGRDLLKEIINNYGINCAILSCDTLQNQRFGFSIEDFYILHNFKTIEYYQDFPLMIFPQNLAISVIKDLKSV